MLDTIFDVCPLVALLLGRKYGRLEGGTHCPAGGVPHGYPDITWCSTKPVDVCVEWTVRAYVLELLALGCLVEASSIRDYLRDLSPRGVSVGQEVGQVARWYALVQPVEHRMGIR